MERTCTNCGVTKYISAFGSGKRSEGGRRSQCKACINAQQRARYSPEKNAAYLRKYRKRDPERRRRYQLKGLYGLTLEDFSQMLKAQNGKCAICGNSDPRHRRKYRPSPHLHVDHCHESGRVRGLLCGTCNKGLGCFSHDASALQSAIRYLTESSIEGRG